MIGVVAKRPWWYAGPILGTFSAIGAAANWVAIGLGGSVRVFQLVAAIAFTINAAFAVTTYAYTRRNGAVSTGRPAWDDDRGFWRV